MRRALAAGSCLAVALVVVGSLWSFAFANLNGHAAGEVLPTGVPRGETVPARMRVAFGSEAEFPEPAPELRRIALELSRRIHFREGLPSCPLADLYAEASPCPGSIVGRGAVLAEFKTPEGEPAGEGEMVAFYNRTHRQSRILARVTTRAPSSITYVIPFAIKPGQRPYGSTLEVRRMRRIVGKCAASHPGCLDQPYTLKGVYGRIRSFEMVLDRKFRLGGKKRGFVEVGCPLRPSRSRGTFPYLRTTLEYVDSRKLEMVLDRACHLTG